MRTLDSERLILRPLQADDEAFYCGLYVDPEVMRHIAEPLSAPAARERFRRALEAGDNPHFWRYWVMTARASQARLGLAGLRRLEDAAEGKTAEIGIVLAPQAQGEGYGPEAALALVADAFQHVEVLIAEHVESNRTCADLMPRLGFSRTSVEGNAKPICRWRLARTDWLGQHHASSGPST